jgi:hypothetical protein
LKKEQMNFRHAAVLALVGWYLIMPPFGKDGKVDLKAPLARWEQADSFDSAEACHQARAQGIEVADLLQARLREELAALMQKLDSVSKEQVDNADPEKLKEFNERMEDLKPGEQDIIDSATRHESSQCIASDDPRLAK